MLFVILRLFVPQVSQATQVSRAPKVRKEPEIGKAPQVSQATQVRKAPQVSIRNIYSVQYMSAEYLKYTKHPK